MRNSLLIRFLIVFSLALSAASLLADSVKKEAKEEALFSVFFNYEAVYPNKGTVKVTLPKDNQIAIGILFDGTVSYNSLYDKEHGLKLDGKRIKPRIEEYPLGLDSVGYVLPTEGLKEGKHVLELWIREDQDTVHHVAITLNMVKPS